MWRVTGDPPDVPPPVNPPPPQPSGPQGSSAASTQLRWLPAEAGG